MLCFRFAFHPVPIFLVINLHRLVGHHLTGAADGTVDRVHRPGTCGFGDEFDLEPRVASRAGGLEQDVAFH